ncbi:MAG: aromatic ring-hydroxylating dioxygenase subunit alpha [Chloroflexota bacterium]
MLTPELNERLARVGPGTPGGKMMRYYWHPVAASAELEENPVKKVRILGEDLVLYRDRSGTLGLIDEPCPHRRVSMEYGIPEQEGLRCPYHGWLFNQDGRCTEQPAEPWNSTFKDRVTTKAYRVQEAAGLVFAYLGPEPAPLLPNYDVFVAPNAIRQIGATMLPCNWLQCQENSLDPIHAEWLHFYYSNYVREREGKPRRDTPVQRHKKIGFSRFEHGVLKRRVLEGETEESDHWQVGHPIVFPNMLRQGAGGRSGFLTFQIRVPVDDTHTWHVFYMSYVPGIPVPPQTSVPFFDVPLNDENGKLIVNYLDGQDMAAWVTQGPLARRDLERLGQSDIGIILFREMLREQVDRAAQGLDPVNVFRDPAANVSIDFPCEGMSSDRFYKGYNLRAGHMRYSPVFGEVADLYHQAEDRLSAGQALLPRRIAPLIPWGAEPQQFHRSALIVPLDQPLPVRRGLYSGVSD